MGCTNSSPGGIKTASQTVARPEDIDCANGGRNILHSELPCSDLAPLQPKQLDNESPQRNLVATPATTADTLSPAPSTGSGNQAIDPGMFIHQQRGSLGERYHREKKLGSGAYGEVGAHFHHDTHIPTFSKARTRQSHNSKRSNNCYAAH